MARSSPSLARGGAALLGAAAVGAAAWLGPETLIRLGPLRTSLQSSIDSVRTMAHVEVAIARVGLALLGVGLWIGLLGGERLRATALVRRLEAHRPSRPAPALAWASLRGTPLALLAGLLIAGLIYTVAFPYLEPRLARRIGDEDGLIEVATALAFLVAAVISARVAWGPAPTMRRVVHAGLALGLLACCGEEISWGQRILGFETPEQLQGMNVQDEANLHNLAGYAADHLFIALVAGYGVVLPLLVARFDLVHKACDLLGLPIASLSLAAGFALASGVHDWSVYRVLPRSEREWFRLAELRELLSAVGLAWMMVEAWRGARATPAAAEGEPAGALPRRGSA